MTSVSRWILGAFASPLGVFVLAALDSTLFFSLPFGIDAVVIILSARLHTYAWIVPLLATLGSLSGAATTYWMGARIGGNGLERYVPPRRLDRVRRRIKNSGAVALAVLDLIPPPFPFTPFVLGAGALGVDRRLFFGTLAVARLFRFGVEAALAAMYGKAILAWLESDIVQDVVVGGIVLAIALTIWSIVTLVRTSRRGDRPAARRCPA